MPLHPITDVLIPCAMIIVMGRCTVWALGTRADMKRGVVSKFEGWSRIVLFAGIGYQ